VVGERAGLAEPDHQLGAEHGKAKGPIVHGATPPEIGSGR
jgi:hypothetical protein